MTAKSTKKLDQRKQKILGSVVNDYIHTAEPVSSDKIAKKYVTKVSPATIRNDMASLEEEGLLKHPHTSSGRIPSDAGYRYFVDQLMKLKELSDKEMDYIKSEFSKSDKNLEDLLHTTLRVTATLSHLLAVITAPKHPFRVMSSGLSNIAEQPEFNRTEEIKNLLNVVEHEDLFADLLEGNMENSPLTIKIGSEIKHNKIKDCSIVMSKYDLFGQSVGTISIIGPTRMTYSKITSIVDAVTSSLKDLLEN
jgi:transcriptional regulator of heat shock response